jgi:hypothetical protein
LLLRYQFIEEALKRYISSADVAIYLCAKPRVFYRGYGPKLSTLPLGGLVEEFRRRNGDADLIKRLRNILVDRNFFAHRGFILSPDERDEEMKALLDRQDRGLREVGFCLKEIVRATCKITGEAVPAMIEEIA